MAHVPLGFTVELDLLAAMDRWRPLPDEGDSGWDEDGWAWAAAERLFAAADLCGEMGWQRGACKVFEHAADWDVHGAMQSIRHGPERAFGDAVADMARQLERLTGHARAGTRLWAVRELGILRQLSSLDDLVRCLDDGHPGVAEQAESSLFMLAQEHHEAVTVVREQAQARTGTVLVAVSVVSDPPPGPLRRPAWVSRVDASQRTSWIIGTSTTPGGSQFDTATLILVGTLELRAGESGRAEVFPDEWSRWQHLGIGAPIELHCVPYGIVATGSVLSIRWPHD